MAPKSRNPNEPKAPLYAKLPVSLHIALQELIAKRWRQTGVKIEQRELLEEAIRRLLAAEGLELSQIETDVSKWNLGKKKPTNVSAFPRRRGRRPA